MQVSMIKEVCMYPAKYKAEVYDSINGTMEDVEGVTIAESFTDAMRKIEDYYGNDLNEVTITLLEAAEIYEFE